MKKYFTLMTIVVLFFACSKKEEELELSSPEAFAYSMDNGWEVIATCRVKGFEQKEEEDQFKAKLSFTVDLQTSTGSLLQGVGEGLIDHSAKERLIDLPVETQVLLDSTYKADKYTIIFNVTDDFSGKSTSIKKEFELTD